MIRNTESICTVWKISHPTVQIGHDPCGCCISVLKVHMRRIALDPHWAKSLLAHSVTEIQRCWCTLGSGYQLTRAKSPESDLGQPQCPRRWTLHLVHLSTLQGHLQIAQNVLCQNGHTTHIYSIPTVHTFWSAMCTPPMYLLVRITDTHTYTTPAP